MTRPAQRTPPAPNDPIGPTGPTDPASPNNSTGQPNQPDRPDQPKRPAHLNDLTDPTGPNEPIAIRLKNEKYSVQIKTNVKKCPVTTTHRIEAPKDLIRPLIAL